MSEQYEAPELVELGTIADFTQGNLLGSSTDGGTAWFGREGKCSPGLSGSFYGIVGGCS